MPIKITTNIDDLEKHINSVFKNMLKSNEISKVSKDAGKAIGRYVGDSLLGGGDSGYDYRQSGGLERLVTEEGRNPEIKQMQNSVTIGVFDLANMNDSWVGAKRNWQYQVHEVWDNKQKAFVKKTISLKEESQLPKWILAEFGSGQYKDGDADLSKYDISYTKRDKPFLFGPSIGRVGGIGGGSKRGFFMVSEKSVSSLYGPERDLFSYRTHSGIHAGHVFSKGLQESKQEVFDILGEGIENYLKNN